MGLQSFLELCAKNAIRPTFANRSKNPLTSPSKYKGGYGGANRIFVPLWQVHSLLELPERRAILSGTSCGPSNTFRIFSRSEKYDLELYESGAIRPPPAPRFARKRKSALPLVARYPEARSSPKIGLCRRLLWLSLLLHQHCQISHAQPQACLILTKR
jgi:hypothetical protein